MAEQRSVYRGRKAMGQIEMYDKTPSYLVAPRYHKMTGVYSDERDDRQMLLSLGAGEIGATLAIPYLPQTPRVSDPDAQGVMRIVECLQRGLNRMGCRLREDGFLGARSTYCLRQVSGRSWHDKAWLQIMGDVIGAIDAGMRIRPRSAQAMGLYADLGAAEALQYKNVSGVCIGSNTYTKSLFTQLQQQLNRVAGARGLRRITVDGKIGSQTVALANQVMDPSVLEPSLLERLLGTKTGCDAIASRAEELVPAIQAFANQLQAAPAEARKTAPRLSPAMVAPSPAKSKWPILLIGAAAVGGAYWYTTQRKGKKKRK
jgi:lysozyme family protein